MTWLYRRIGPATFESSEYTRTGWNTTDQHGGPPSALLAHVIQGVDLPVPMQMTRITVSLLRPVPIAPLTVRTRVLRAGKRVAVVEADLMLDGTGDLLVTAQAQMIRVEPIPLEAVPRSGFTVPAPPLQHPPVADLGTGDWIDATVPRFHLHAAERRSVDRGWETLGPGEGWFRMVLEVVDDEPVNLLTKFVAIADMANGLSSALDIDRYMWVNPDITVAFARPPRTEWLGMRAEADPQEHGVGLVHAWGFDEHGPFGHILQTQLLVHNQ